MSPQQGSNQRRCKGPGNVSWHCVIFENSVLVTTHRAEEARCCDRMVVMDRGHVVCTETPERLMSNVAGDVISMEVDEPEDLVRGLKEQLGANPRVVDGIVEWERPDIAQIPALLRSLNHVCFIR